MPSRWSGLLKSRAKKQGNTKAHEQANKQSNKLKNMPTTVGGVKFDSKKEARRFQELQMMERAKLISDLKLQVPFELIPSQKKPRGGTERAVKYIADFTYCDHVGSLIVEDTKSPASKKQADYIIKRKLMLQVHGVEILET